MLESSILSSLVRRCVQSMRIIYRCSHLDFPQLDFTSPISEKNRQQKYNRTIDKQPLFTRLRGQCLFGIHPVYLALKMKRRQFYKLYLNKNFDQERPLTTDIISMAKDLSIITENISPLELDQLSFDRPHQGVCLDCSSLPVSSINEMNDEQNTSNLIKLDLLLYQIIDPMNLGAIVRSAHFFGIDRLILSKNTCQPSPIASKASSGTLETMTIYLCENIDTYLKTLINSKKTIIISANNRSEMNLQKFSIDKIKTDHGSITRILLIVGNEHRGISSDLASYCHYQYKISPHAKSLITSLNVSVALGLFLYHLTLQLNKL